MKKKRAYFPRPVLKNLAEEIKKLVITNEGRMFLLEMVEDIPIELRPHILEGLSSFYEKEMVAFFYLLKMEYGKEFEASLARGLEKFRMAGLDIANPIAFSGEFHGAFASCTRHSGRMTLDVAWDVGGAGVQVECFYLTFNPDGIHSFFVIEDMTRQQYEQDRRALSDIVPVTLEEARAIIAQVYSFNVRHMTRPALGRYLYEKYLPQEDDFTTQDQMEVMKKITPRLAPRQLVNSFFFALKSKDDLYMQYLTAGKEDLISLFTLDCDEILTPGAVLLEGQVREVQGSRHTARVSAYSVTLEAGEFYRSEFRFYLLATSGIWSIGDIEKTEKELVPAESEMHPLKAQVYCRVYEIVDLDNLFELLDRVENMREIQELTYGMHMRVSSYEDDFSHGVALLTGVVADLVVNGDEFVVVVRDQDTLGDFHNLLAGENDSPIVLRGEYEVGLMTAYNYLGGQYPSFEELLLQEDGELFGEDGMRFLTARYYIKDLKPVQNRLESLKSLKVQLEDQYTVYYQMDNQPARAGLFVEYVLGPGWLSLSAFGENDINQARKEFEERMYDCLEFEGMEIKDEGLFEVLTADVCKEHPELEAVLKEIYLDKWCNSRLPSLSGMSPSEASQTEEGTRLLWAMFKKIKQKENNQYLYARRGRIRLHEYIRKLEQKREGQN